MSISRPVIPDVPVYKDSNGGKTNIKTYDQVSDKDPSSNDLFIMSSRFLFHAERIRRVERKSGSG